MAGIGKWKWIVASVIICVGLGVLYLARTPNTYTATAAVEIKDDDNSTMNSALSTFADMGLGTSNSNLYNEMAYFQSPDLMEAVVERLGLDVSYTLKTGLKRISPYYNELPVEVQFIDLPDNGSGSFRMQIDEEGMVTLDKFKIKKDKFDYKSPRFKLGSKVKTPMGWIAVVKGPAYEEGEAYKMGVSKQTLRGAATAWASRLKVNEQSKDATVIDLTLSDQSPARAIAVLNALIEAYNHNWILDKNQVAVSTSSFINDRLAVIEDELGNVDSDISSYKSQNLVPDVATTAALYLTENQETDKAILALNNQLQMARFLKEHLLKNPSNDKTLPVNTGITNKSVEEQLAKYNELVIQRNSLAANSSPNNPIVMDIDQRLDAMRSAIAGSLDNEIQSLNTDMRNLTMKQGSVTGKIAASPTQAKYLLSVERQQKVKESLYLYLLQKREENELNQAFTAYNTRVIARPDVNEDATSPRRGMILGVAFLFGLILPFGLVYIQESSNTKVRGREDLSKLTIPFLGEIPTYKASRGENPNSLLLVKSGERNVINEAFRVVRTNLTMLEGGDKTNVIMVSSFNPGSGKTFITMNLAQSLAIRGKKVLVIDGDMRRGSASAYIGGPKEGLAQYLSGKAPDLDSLIRQTKFSPNLYILPSGKVPPNPTELLETGHFAQMIEDLKKEYDYIFIDCPPVGIVADARIIGTVCDRSIFIIRAGLLERSMLPELEKMYHDKTYTNMTVMLNGSSSEIARYGYNYGYATKGQKNYYTVD